MNEIAEPVPTNIIDLRPLLKEVEEQRLKAFYQQIADMAKHAPNEHPKP